MHTSSLLRRPQHRRRAAVLALPALAAAAAIALAACSPSAASPSSSPGSSTPYGGAAPSTSPSPAPAGGAALGVRSTSLGTILTDGRGFTVYAFEADQGTTSACSGACATAWPPLTTTSTSPQAGTGASQTLLGQAKRADGSTQLTYAGHPLYLFTGDSAAGETNGQGLTAFGARWDVLTPTGQEVTTGG